MKNYLFLIILIIFIIFIFVQVYYYSDIVNRNHNLIKDIESYENKLQNINSTYNYVLDDKSIEILLDDYYKLKNTI
jgi:predicted PurR-regulated permease PerM